jgi:hypothetical protein
MATGQQIGEYFEKSFEFHLSSLYNIASSTNLNIEAVNLGLTSAEKIKVDNESNDTAIKVKSKLSQYYDIPPSVIRQVPKNPKTSKFFTKIYSEFDDSNPSDILLEYSSKKIPEEKYFGVSLKRTAKNTKTVKANLGVTDILQLFGKIGNGTNWASNFLYDQFAKKIVQDRKNDVETNYINYGLTNTPKNHFSTSSSAKWFNAQFVRSLPKNKILFQNDAIQIKNNYVNYFEQELNKLSQDTLKKFIIEDALKEVSLPLYIVAKSSGGIFSSYSTNKILDIASSDIVVNTRKTPQGGTRIILKRKQGVDSIIEIRIKFSSGQDMTSPIKVEIT